VIAILLVILPLHFQTAGTPIPLNQGESAWDALGYTDKSYCWNDNSTANKDIYGGLYTWVAAMNRAANGDANPSRVETA